MVMSLWPRFLAHPVYNLSACAFDFAGKCMTQLVIMLII